VASRPGDQRLRAYRDKRDFARTPEPEGDTSGPDRGRFVVQRHRARRLHYDFRLEINGVLASWAVPKGPTLDPSVRRLAVHVEDHPIEYRDFEGVIPAGEYGGGDVIVWDRGTWTPVDTTDPARAIADGELHFDLDGEKLKGRFVLVRTGRPADGDKEQWILLHKRDEFAQQGWDPEAHPASVKSGRTNDETAADPDALWDSNAPADRAEVRLRPPDSSSGTAAHDATPRELRALSTLAADGSWKVDGSAVPLTDLDRILWPAGDDEQAVTKRDLVRYYASTASSLLPYLVGRRVGVRRYPDGIEHGGHWRHQTIDGAAALAEVANDAGVELAVAPSLAETPDRPQWAFVDIVGAPSTAFADLVDVARLFRTALEHLGVAGCPKLDGEDGIEIWIPVAARHTWRDTKAWVEKLCQTVGTIAADLERRPGSARPRVRMDAGRNAPEHELIAPFSPRPKPGAPVSVPISWDELDDPKLAADRWSIRTIGGRLRRVGDPLHGLIGLQQRLPPWS
jgi:bifunctional non-homologous end joining protein LigD